MSWDVYLKKDDKVVKVDSHEEGGTYAMGGTTNAELNITYNYSWFYYQLLDKGKGLKWIDGKVAKDTIDQLQKAVTALGIRQNKDYWADTPGNAGYALMVLLCWAKANPEAIFQVT